MTLVSIGIIEKIQYHDKGYYKLVLYIPCPIEAKYLRFCVLKADLLRNKETGKEFQVGNKVKVVYHLLEKRYNFLDDLIPAKIDDCCPLCDKSLGESLLRDMYHLDIS